VSPELFWDTRLRHPIQAAMSCAQALSNLFNLGETPWEWKLRRT